MSFVSLKFFVLLFLAFHEVFPLLVLLFEDGFFLKLVSLVIFALHLCNLFFESLNFLHLVLLIDLTTSGLCLFIVDVLLEVSNSVNLLHGHTDSTTNILSLLPDLSDLLFALFERFLLFVVGALQNVVLGLVLLFKRAQVLIANDLV